MRDDLIAVLGLVLMLLIGLALTNGVVGVIAWAMKAWPR